jgi:hypothetical protein
MASPPPVAQVVEGFFKDLLGAKKAVRLYPAGNPQANEWMSRLHRSLETALKDGLPPVLRIAPGRFEWEGGQLVTKDQALESFRFELETRRITEMAIDPGVEPWELQHFLDCLNLRQEDVDQGGGLPALLGQRNVVHITLRGPLWGDGTGPGGAPGAGTSRLEQLEGLVTAVLDAVADEFRTLAYDRVRLSGWFAELAHPGDRAEVVAQAVQMLIPLAEAEPDREIRYRALNECLMALPDPLRSTVINEGLLPAVRTNLNVLNLLTRLSGDEFAELVGLLPGNWLDGLRAEIEALPAEEWKKARLVESLEDALAERELAAAPVEPLIADDDPGLLALRDAARTCSSSEAALEHSLPILFYLVGESESEGYPALLIDALEEAVTEALGRGQLRLALRTLQRLAQPPELRPEWQTEHQRRLQLLHRRLGGRSQVVLLADVLRRRDAPDDLPDATEYLRTLGREALGEFVGIVGEEPDAGTRGRMIEVLAAIGLPAAPAVRARVGNGSWQVVRAMIGLLARFGDPEGVAAIQEVAGHEHPQVRREAARALAALGGKQALPRLLEYLSDTDAEVRLAAIKLIGGLLDANTVAPLRAFLVTPTRGASDLLVKREMMTALASVGSPQARAVLESIAQRRVWPWQRNELTVRDLAVEAIKSIGQPTSTPTPVGREA